MKQVNKLIINILTINIFYIFITSCNNEGITSEKVDNSGYTIKREHLSSFENRKKIAQALATALNDSEPLRLFLKKEALKMFDKDYDVLYHKVKNEYVSENITFREVIARYFKDEIEFKNIEDNSPLLTILIPELPENTFSADLWDTSQQIPLVAIVSKDNKKALFYNHTGYDSALEVEYIPAFPAIVVKDCERVKVVDFTSKSTEEYLSDFCYDFIDPIFDNSIKQSESEALRLKSGITDNKVITAYNTYKNTDGWQRDYIYYDISPTQTRGEFKYTHQEHLTSFRLGSPYMTNVTAILSRISDGTGDPGCGMTWADGAFEFRITIKVNSKTGIGEEIKRVFMLKTSQLCNLIKNGNSYALGEPKTVDLNIPLFNWDLYDISPSIKISIEEIDPSETVTLYRSETSVFANNFEVSANIYKVGAKYGTSQTSTKVTETQTVYNLDSDKLGDVIVNFADKIILNDNHEKRKYFNTSYTITIEPRKVQ